MSWLDRQFEPLVAHGDRPGVVLDPDGLAAPSDLVQFGAVYACADWVSLRRAYEFYVRNAPSGSRPVLLVQHPAMAAARDLPWDIEQNCAVAPVSWPVEGDWRGVLRQLGSPLADLVVEIVSRERPERVTSKVLRDGFGVTLPASSAASELDGVARLRTDPSTPEALWPMVRPLLKGPLAKALAASPPDLTQIQEAWDSWLSEGEKSTWAPTVSGAASAFVILHVAGLIRPAPLLAADLPTWAIIGAAAPDPSAHLRGLLTQRPHPWPPSTSSDWMAAAAWWGDVRAAMAEGMNTEDRAAGWQVWAELNGVFVPWLFANLGLLMTRQATLPLAVNQIAPFLARRLRTNDRPMLLVVIDGMAFAQWSILRRDLSLGIVEVAGCFAMCPTLTSVSRQAIFAGAWPADYSDSLWSTARERDRWFAFWAKEGLPKSGVEWLHVKGSDASEVPVVSQRKVVGIVVGAVDDLLHGSKVNGDAQVAASVRTWARFGFLRELVKSAHSLGFEVWITADHGNIEATPSGRVMEGLSVEQAGTRVRIYDSPNLRDAARADGFPWDPPGHPRGRSFLFAPGRTGYHSGGPRVTHGGLSLDEVIVPFAQVVPG